jgi:addiction module HigA family antidote
MRTNTLPPIHPGEILREEFMKPRGLSLNGLARALNVLPRRVNEIVLEKRGISADTALRLAGYPASLRLPVQSRSKVARARLTSWTGGNCHNESG